MSTAINFNADGKVWEFNGQSTLDANRSFSDGNRDFALEKKRGLNVWRAEKVDGQLNLDDRGIGQIIGFCTGNGITWVTFHGCTVSVNYLTKMLQFKAKHGWFVDFLVDNDDHNFDGNVPTPGGAWGEGRRLLNEAAELDKVAGLARGAWHLDEAADYERQSRDLKTRGRELLFSRR